tara:strand:- start:71 stop:367 length:297 start_codon:yes stop_codon:yes gene_type:complete
MKNHTRGILKHHLGYFDWKWYITISLVLFSLISCSNALIFKREMPKPVEYSRIEFKNCNSPDNAQYLCLSKIDAEKSVIDLKKCQEQNVLLRELLNGN